MGVVGMSLEDFCRLRLDEVDAVLRSNAEARRGEAQRAWEVMRMQTSMILGPFCKNLPSPDKLLPFPWDKTSDEEEPEVPITQEERIEQERRLRAALGW